MLKASQNLIREKLIAPMTVQWEVPRQVAKSTEGQALYCDQIIEALHAKSMTIEELDPTWKRLLMDHKRYAWPTAHQVLEVLDDVRSALNAAQISPRLERLKADLAARNRDMWADYERGKQWGTALLESEHGKRAAEGGYAGYLRDWGRDNPDQWPTEKDHVRWKQSLSKRLAWFAEMGAKPQMNAVERQAFLSGRNVHQVNVDLNAEYLEHHGVER